MAQDLLDYDSAMVKTPAGKHAMAVAAADVPLDVAIQDQTSRLVDRFLTQKLGTTTLTASQASPSSSMEAKRLQLYLPQISAARASLVSKIPVNSAPFSEA